MVCLLNLQYIHAKLLNVLIMYVRIRPCAYARVHTPIRILPCAYACAHTPCTHTCAHTSVPVQIRLYSYVTMCCPLKVDQQCQVLVYMYLRYQLQNQSTYTCRQRVQVLMWLLGWVHHSLHNA